MRIAPLLLATLLGAPAGAQLVPPAGPTTIAISGGAVGASQQLPPGQAAFGLRVPLKPNAENVLAVTATDDRGNVVTAPSFTITQLSLTSIVQAQVTAQRLTTAEVQQLVSDGTIDIIDPANFNVSKFDIVLTVGGQQVPVSVPIVKPVDDPVAIGTGPPITIVCAQPGQGLQTTGHSIAIPCGGGGGGPPPNQPPIQLIPFTIDVPDMPEVPSIPGVIVIDGTIKTLKEFFRVTLMLSNVSQLFTLTDVMATISVPPGALTPIAPASGPLMLADLPPGAQDDGDFIVRGDQIGVHTVTVNFGGNVTGLGLAQPVPVSGSASTDLEVKGPPTLAVTVSHPDFVTGGQPYQLTVDVADTSPDLPALFASLALDVGADARLIDDSTGQPVAGPVTRSLGDLQPGQHVTQTFTVLPLATGPITSCAAAASTNVQLSVVFTGGAGPGCAVGTLPATQTNASGRPTVTVVPPHNTTDVAVNAVVTALFSAPMLTDTITTGFTGATFLVTDPTGAIVPGSLEIGALGSGNTVAIFHPASLLAFATQYTVVVQPTIFDQDGLQLASGLTARFTTAAAPVALDTTPPEAHILIQPPVNPTAVLQGQMLPIEVDATDDVGVAHVDLLLDGAFVDTARPMSPVHFMLDTAALAPGTMHTLTARAVDAAGNVGTDQASFTMFADTTPPSVQILSPPTVARGRMLAVTVAAADDGHVTRVELFLDGSGTPVFTGVMPPFVTGLPTASLAAGLHSLHAQVTDGAGNTAGTDQSFTVVDDTTPPVVVITAPLAGTAVRVGTALPVTATVTDDVGVAHVEFFVDAEAAPRASDVPGFTLGTTALTPGPHGITVMAQDLAGNQAQASVAFDVVVVPTDTTPPAAPDPALIAATPPANGLATVSGTAGAVEGGAEVEITDLANQAVAMTPAAADGHFAAQIDAAGGDTLRLVAVDAAGNRSAPTDVSVPVPPSLVGLQVTPSPVVLDKNHLSQQLTVRGTFSDGSQGLLATGLLFTSDDPSTAAVTPGGLVLPGKNGGTTVHVKAGALPPVDVPVTVSFPTVTGVQVSPASVHLLDLGRTQPLAVVADLSDGSTAPFPGTVAFGAEDATVATVDNAGVVTGVGEGSTTVIVAPTGFAAISVPVQVDKAVLQTIFTVPGSVSLVGVGATQGLAVFGTFSDGSQRPVSGATFSSNVPAVATVDAGGTVTAAGNGDGSIHVTVGGAPPIDVPVHVKSLVSIALAPASFTLIGTGKMQGLSVVGTFTDNSTSPIPTTGVVFQSDHTNVATVDGSGVVTSKGLGNATITGTLAGFTPAQSTVSVIARTPDGIRVSPPSLELTTAGQKVTLDISFHFNDGTTGPPTASVLFNSDNAAIATVDASGTVTAVATGMIEIHVASGTLTADVPVNVAIPSSMPPPHIDVVDRPRAAEGDAFVIRGSGFAALPADDTVTVNGLAATVVSARQEELVALVPERATDGSVQVFVGTQSSNTVPLGIYPRVAQSQELTPAIPQPPTPLVLNVPAFEFRAGDRVLLSSARDVPAPLAFTGTLTARVDGGSPIPISPSADATDLSAAFTPGLHSLQLTLADTGSGSSTGAIFLLRGPDATGPIASGHSVIALGQSRPIPVTFTNLVDLAAAPLPDGTVVAVETLGNCDVRDRQGNCINSAGGLLSGGSQSPELGNGDARIENFVVSGGRVDVLYDPSGIQVDVPTATQTAVVALLPTNPDGTRNGRTAFATIPVTLTTIDSAAGPRSTSTVVADGLPKTVTIALRDFRDTLGQRVPDGVTTAAETIGNCDLRDHAGNCVNSAGGNIVNGAQSPELSNGDERIATFTLTNGQAAVQYDPGSIVVPFGQLPTANVSVLPATPSGNRIGRTAFEEVPITLSSAFAQQADVTIVPTSVLADGGDNRVTITVTNITDSLGNPVPDHTKVAAETLGNCDVRDQQGNCVNSAGGLIENGNQSPELGNGDQRIEWFEVMNGQVTIVYSAVGVAIGTGQTATANVSLVPASSTSPVGTRIGRTAFAVATVTLTGYDSSTAVADPPDAVGDGLDKTIVITVSGIRDVNGNLPPDGALVAAETLGNCDVRDRQGNCVNSAGGVITNGLQSPELGKGDNRIKLFPVTNGQIVVDYDPQGVLVGVGNLATANVSLLPALPSGQRIGRQAFTVVPITLSPPTTDPMNVSVVPQTVLADGGNNQVVVTVSGITDVDGRPVPDHTTVAVETLGNCDVRDPQGNCVNSAGGVLVNGAQSPELSNGDERIQLFQVINGRVQVVYSDIGIARGTNASDTAVVSFVPSTPSGSRIGRTAFVVASVGLVGYGSGTITGPGDVGAGAQTSYTVSNLQDLAGNPIPDGSKIAVFTIGNCFARDSQGNCINSAEGAIGGGAQSPDLGNGDARGEVFSVQGGGFGFRFTAPAGGTSIIYLMPANPSGNRIGSEAFALRTVTIGP